ARRGRGAGEVEQPELDRGAAARSAASLGVPDRAVRAQAPRNARAPHSCGRSYRLPLAAWITKGEVALLEPLPVLAVPEREHRPRAGGIPPDGSPDAAEVSRRTASRLIASEFDRDRARDLEAAVHRMPARAAAGRLDDEEPTATPSGRGCGDR